MIKRTGNRIELSITLNMHVPLALYLNMSVPIPERFLSGVGVEPGFISTGSLMTQIAKNASD